MKYGSIVVSMVLAHVERIEMGLYEVVVFVWLWDGHDVSQLPHV